MNRRCVLIGFIAAFMLCVLSPVFAQQQIVVTIPAKMDIMTDQFEFVAQMLPLKDGFVPGKAHGDKTPIANLDMFLRVKTSIDGKAMPFTPPTIVLAIPFSFVKKVNEKANKDTVVNNLSFWVPDASKGGKWIALKSLGKEIGKVTLEGDLIMIEIKSWPLDDRMIGC
jgi:hypothetical protein